MGLSVNGQNDACDGIATGATFSGLHTGDPSTTGANEATGGGYARVAAAWSAAASGQRLSSGAQLFNVAAGTYYWISKWNASSAGVYKGAAPLGGQPPKVGNAAITTGVITAYAHGYVNTDRVVLEQFQGNALPTGLTEGVVYYVTNATTDTFTVSLTSGGATVTTSTAGGLWVQKCIPETFGATGQLSVAAGSDAIDCRGL